MQPNQFARNYYADAGVDVDAFETEIDKELDRRPTVSGGNVLVVLWIFQSKLSFDYIS